MADVRTKLKVLKKAKSGVHCDWQALESDSQIKLEYAVTVKNRFQGTEAVESLEEKWNTFQQALVVSEEEVLPRMKRTAKQWWMKQEILYRMEEPISQSIIYY